MKESKVEDTISYLKEIRRDVRDTANDLVDMGNEVVGAWSALSRADRNIVDAIMELEELIDEDNAY